MIPSLCISLFTAFTPRYRGVPISRKSMKTTSKVHADYAAMVECLDENVGRLMGALDELGLRDNTIVLVFLR